jgi:hypothetical protein
MNLTSLSLPKCPRTLEEAFDASFPNCEMWIEVTMKELQMMTDMKCFEIADIQAGRGMKVKFVYTVTYKNDYTLKYKCRLVACGYSQIKGLDYIETFSPTPSIVYVLILLQISGVYKLSFKNFDISSAFIEGKNDLENFAWLPGFLFKDNIKRRYKVIRSLYGEKQAPKIFYELMYELLSDWGFIRCPVATTLFMKTYDKNNYMIIVIHVDDGLMVSTNNKYIDEFMMDMNKRFKTTLYDPTQIYLGMEIQRQDQYIHIHQKMYIDSLRNDYSHRSDESTPMNSNYNLRKEQPNENNESLLPIIGKLRYLCDRTRPDILLSVGETSTGGTVNPSDMHINTSKRILNYLFSTDTKKLKLGGNYISFFGYCDASYITTGNSHSRLGGCLFLGHDSGSIYNICVNDTIVSHSSCEAEIKAIDKAILSIIHIKDILLFMNIDIPDATILYCDNKSAIELCKTLKTTNQTKHINMRINFIREKINDRTISIIFVPSEYNVADVLTKPLSDKLFNRHSDILLFGHSTSSTSFHHSSNYTLNEVNEIIVKHGMNMTKINNELKQYSVMI